MSTRQNRREFLRTTATIGAGLAAIGTTARGAAPPATTPASGPTTQPADRLTVGIMGTGGRGIDLCKAFTALGTARVAYVCDVDAKHAAAAARVVAAAQGSDPVVAGDFRRILDDRSVDALVIAAPDHWHAPATILACAAGKHVYVEKPACHNPREGEWMVAAARRHDRVVQLGTQRRNWPRVIEAIGKVRGGEIGRVTLARAWYANDRPTIGRGKETPPPPGLDYELWQGPAPRQPYHDNVIPYQWHWFWQWGTGELGNNGVHMLDVCRWGLGVDCPRRIVSGGGRYCFDDDQQTPDTQTATFDFGDRAILWDGQSCHGRGSDGIAAGVAFYGDAATLVIDGNGYRVYDKKGAVAHQVAESADTLHPHDFVESVRAGRRPAADIEEGVKSTLLCHVGNIAWRVGRSVNLDPGTHKIVADPAAEALWGRTYQPGWEPKA